MPAQIVGLARSLPEPPPNTPTENHSTPAGNRSANSWSGCDPGSLNLNDADATCSPWPGRCSRKPSETRFDREPRQIRAGTAAAREEERRRLRRDLHDGLGPPLSGIAFTADAAQLSTSDPGPRAAHWEESGPKRSPPSEKYANSSTGYAHPHSTKSGSSKPSDSKHPGCCAASRDM